MFSVGIIIQLIFLFSIFDIYFKSPIVHNITPYQPHHKPLAHRLVLIVVDGLRADSFVNDTTMSYLRALGNSEGRWGISNTRVPTESRPGHVAITAGFYEDPSAVFKGWKENPVDFDSVFNQSKYTWCWGAYDIMDIFSKGNIGNHISFHKYDPYVQSFSADKETRLIDLWVFDSIHNFFQYSYDDADLTNRLHSQKLIFFLHLIATDTVGHTHKPNSENYLETIDNVDLGIHETVYKFNRYYRNDGKTTFLITSDHGMTDWGSHGTGDNHETQTPYVLWGAGVNRPRISLVKDPETNGMRILNRLDISQADLAPIIASFLSIPVPVNSIGRLHTDLMEAPLSTKAMALYSNSRQLLSQYNKKRLDVEINAIPLIYQPFELFNGSKVNEIIKFSEELLQTKQYDKLMDVSEEIIMLSRKGLNYYHNYYQRPLLFSVTLSFMGWIFFLLKSVLVQTLLIQAEKCIENNKIIKNKSYFDIIIKSILILLSVSLFFIIYVQHLPLQYYIYFLLPTFLWWNVLTPIKVWFETLKNVNSKKEMLMIAGEVLCYTIASILLGLSFSHRWLLSIPLCGMGLWPFFSSYNHLLTINISIIWAAGCMLLSAFSFMPVVGKQVVIGFVITAGVIGLISMLIYMYVLHRNNESNKYNMEMCVCSGQMFLLIMSLCIIHVQSKNFAVEAPISLSLQTVCWIVAVILPVLPALYTRRILNRLVGINFSILIFYLLLSVSHEALFLITLMLNVNCWMIIEYKLLDLHNSKITYFSFGNDNEEENYDLLPGDRSISNRDFRRSFFFTIYIILAYFGTGNIASLNSFEVRWVICFTTSYRPFIITTLILLKTLAPFLSVACSFRAIQQFTKAPTGYLNMIVLIYSNIMGLLLLYFVKNVGSWLEIGMSISQFVIVQAITLFVVVIHQIARGLTEIVISKPYIFSKIKKHV